MFLRSFKYNETKCKLRKLIKFGIQNLKLDGIGLAA